MRYKIFPGHPLQGEFYPPGDKSLSHRTALLAGLAAGESRVENFLVAGVTRAMLESLSGLGVHWELDGTTLQVTGTGVKGLKSPAQSLNCGNSATTMRLLAGALVAAGVPVVLDGSAGLRRRPMGRIVTPLQRMGAGISATDGHAPLTLLPEEHQLRGIEYRLPVASAQVKSCLLLAGLASRGITQLYEPGPSRDHTERLLVQLGFDLERWMTDPDKEGKSWYATRLTPPAELDLAPVRTRLPGDFSSAAFLIVAALITPDSAITLRQVGLNPTRTGLLDALRAMGADIHVHNQSMIAGEPVGDLVVRASDLQGIEVAGSLVVRMIDEFPVFAVAAAFGRGETRVSGAQELRHKESDRISTLCTELRKIGVEVIEAADGFTILGSRKPRGGVIDPHGDHRLALALGVGGLAAQESIEIRTAEISAESFPDFPLALRMLGAQVVVQE